MGRTIIILSEGETEELATRYFVLRQWRADGLGSIGLRPINLGGKLKEIGLRGTLYLDDPDVIAVFTLLDLQGMTLVSHGPHDELAVRVQRVRDWLRGQIVHERSRDFFAHVSVHETEAWILAEGLALSKRLANPDIRPDPQAESRDFANPPSRRLNDLFLRHRSRNRYNKILDGRPLFSDMEFAPVYSCCQYFRSFYDDLRDVARRQEMNSDPVIS